MRNRNSNIDGLEEKNRRNFEKGRAPLFLKVTLRTKSITRDKKRNSMLEGLVHKEDIIKNVYVSHNRASKYTKQKLTTPKGQNQ